MKRVLVLLLLMASSVVKADDIDIYQNGSGTSSAEPLVMLSLDYNSNLSATVCNGTECNALVTQGYLTSVPTSRFNLYRAVLKKVLDSVSGIKIGFMLNHNNNNNCAGPTKTGCSNGGYILFGFQSMQAGDANGAKAALANKLAKIPTPQGGVSHPYQGKELFFELFRYLSGQGIYNGHNGWTDFGTNSTYNLSSASDYSPSNTAVPLSWDTTIESGTNYINPVSSSCQKLYTVNILFNVSASEDDSDTAITASAAAGGMGGINISGTNNSFPTIIRWMYDNDLNSAVSGKQRVISYFIVSQVNTKTQAYAGAGVGVSSAQPYQLSDDPTTLQATFATVLKNVLAVSTTFTAPSVAVNVYNRAQVRNEVYIAMFQADENGYPGWPGDLKKYAIGTNAAGDLEIEDVNSTFAVASDGRISYDALSYWTIASDLAAPATDSTDVAGKDGRSVKRGGAGSKIPGYKQNGPGLTNPTGDTTNITSRKLFTEPSTFTNGTATALMALNANVSTATTLQSALGATSVGSCSSSDPNTAACRLLIFARGLEWDSTNSAWKSRSWIMGDLLHSRPIAINYGARGSYTTSNPDIRLIAGSNDGFLHMFRNTKVGQTDPKVPNDSDGVETWAFMPREVMPTLNTLIAVNQTTTPPHPYTVDGAPTVYIYDANGNGNIETGDKVYLFFGLRRGGYSYYALDITDPDNPQILWRITKGATGTDFAELGQTWSTPHVTKMLYDGSTTPRPVLIFSGGYDPNKDTHSGHGTYTTTGIGSNDSQGNALFIVNAETGALVWKAIKGTSNGYVAASKAYKRTDLVDSIPSEVTAVDSDGNKLVDRIYVGDTGGVLWRADLRSADQANWTMTPILSVGRHATNTLANDRRFFYPPDYVQSKDSIGPFDGLVIGSGDRENPLDVSVTNWVYMFKDRNITSGTLDVAYNYPETGTALGDVTDYTYSSSLNLDKGWRLQLKCPPTYSSPCGEKSLASAFTIAGKTYLTTYKPPSSVTATGCSLAEGGGLVYALSFQDGKAVEDFDATNNTGTQTLFASDRSDELASGGIPAEVVSLGGGKILQPDLYIRDTNTNDGFKTYWYEKSK